MSKEELLESMEYLSWHMATVSGEIKYFAGFNKGLVSHADELKGASEIVKAWIEGIKDDTKL